MNRGFVNKLWVLIQLSWSQSRAPLLTRLHGVIFPMIFLYILIDYRTIEPARSFFSSLFLHFFYIVAWFHSVWAVNISRSTIRGHLPPDFNFGGTLEYSVRIWNTFAVMCVSFLSLVVLFDWRFRGIALMVASTAVCTIPGLRFALRETQKRMDEILAANQTQLKGQGWRIRQVSIPDYLKN